MSTVTNTSILYNNIYFLNFFSLQSGGGFTLVDFTIPTREVPIAHPGAQAPLCDEVSRSNDCVAVCTSS